MFLCRWESCSGVREWRVSLADGDGETLFLPGGRGGGRETEVRDLWVPAQCGQPEW